MVYTVTFNPAVDYVMHTEALQVGCVNRAQAEQVYFGGKGINVSLVLHELGVPSKALGFVGGFTGKAIEEGIRTKGVETDFVWLQEGFSRINIKIRSAEETELNGVGPKIDERDIRQLYQKLEVLRDGDMLVLAGSIPKTIPNDIYEKILARVSKKKIKSTVDATGALLLNVLKYKPFLIKPNIHELEEIFRVKMKEKADVISYARKLKEMGAVNVLVSMAKDGAILVDERGEVHTCGVCRGNVKNSVGAGDSMVAGFLVGEQNGDYDYALKLGTAAGGATAFSDGLATKSEIEKLLKQL